VKFLVDAQLPRRFCIWLEEAGHDAKHTLDLPLANRTPDCDIVQLADEEKRVVVTKDNDFLEAFLVSGHPFKLLLVTTGNISNADLEELIRNNLSAIVNAFDSSRLIEIRQDDFLIRE